MSKLSCILYRHIFISHISSSFTVGEKFWPVQGERQRVRVFVCGGGEGWAVANGLKVQWLINSV